MKNVLTSLILSVALFSFATMTSAQDTLKFSTITPVPSSGFHNPEQTICLRAEKAIDPISIQEDIMEVTGSISGRIAGKVILSDDMKELIFKPLHPFIFGERVMVSVGTGLKTIDNSAIEGLSFYFDISDRDNRDLLIEYYKAEYPEMTRTQASCQDRTGKKKIHWDRDTHLPDNYPAPEISRYGEVGDDYIFYSILYLNQVTYGNYISIWDKYGTPIFFQEHPANLPAIDFRVLPDGRLTYASFSIFDPGAQKYFLLDSSYQVTDTVLMGNGYNVDPHDIIPMDNDHYLLMAYDPQLVDMSQVVPGGDTNATVIGLVIQEVDLEQNVYFQWRSWDHFEITDASEDIDLTAATIDYCHGNAIELTPEGDILLSSRNMDEITRIGYPGGDIIWRWGLGAKNNEFEFLNDTAGFSHQHDIRLLPDGHYTVFDNGNLHTPEPYSRGVEYALDETNKTATLVWNYRNDPSVFAFATGSHRPTSDGHRIIGWGLTFTDTLMASEVDMDGNKIMDIFLPDSLGGYRTLKFPWKTNMFTTSKELIDFGVFTGYTPIPRIFTVTNTFSDSITITSTQNHLSAYYVSTSLPMDIAPGETKNMTINFFPSVQGIFNDVLTIIYDNEETVTRVARQIKLAGRTPDNTPPEVTIEPANGSTQVDPDTTVILTFSEPVFKAGGGEITGQDIEGMLIFKKDGPEGEDVLFAGSINAEFTSITATPASPLATNQNYYAELPSGSVEDAAGNALEDAVISYFTTGVDFGIGEQEEENISCFPNPTNGKIYIQLNGKRLEEIRVFDLNGKVVSEIKDPAGVVEIDLCSQSSGIYLIRWKDTGGSAGNFKVLNEQ